MFLGCGLVVPNAVAYSQAKGLKDTTFSSAWESFAQRTEAGSDLDPTKRSVVWGYCSRVMAAGAHQATTVDKMIEQGSCFDTLEEDELIEFTREHKESKLVLVVLSASTR